MCDCVCARCHVMNWHPIQGLFLPLSSVPAYIFKTIFKWVSMGNVVKQYKCLYDHADTLNAIKQVLTVMFCQNW